MPLKGSFAQSVGTARRPVLLLRMPAPLILAGLAALEPGKRGVCRSVINAPNELSPAGPGPVLVPLQGAIGSEETLLSFFAQPRDYRIAALCRQIRTLLAVNRFVG